jgi:hypothetical protein
MPPLQLPIGEGKGRQSGNSPIVDAAGVGTPQQEDYARGDKEQHEERQAWPKELRGKFLGSCCIVTPALASRCCVK